MSILNIINKFRQILTRHQKCRIFELGLLMIFGGFLETCSVSLILPFMDAVMSPAATMDRWYVRYICKLLGLESPRAFLILLAFFLAVLYIFKNLYLMLEYNIQYRFVYANMFALQKRLLRAFVNRPYEYFLNVNSGEVIRIISSDTNAAFSLLTTMLSMFTELVVSGMLVIAIFVIMPMVTLCIAVILLLLMLFVYVVLKPVLRKESFNQQRAGAGMNKWLLQSIQGIKELKVMRKENFFQSNFDQNGRIYVHSLRWGQTLSTVPRFIIEGISMGTMFIIVACLIYRGTDLESIIPMLTAVAMAAIRLLPSVNRISGALNGISYGEPMLDKVMENLKILDEPINLKIYGSSNDHTDKQKEPVVFTRLKDRIEFQGISFHYPDSEEMVLRDASMTIKKGESVGIVGPSGAGKTTSVDIILGLLKPQGGRILVDGVNIETNIGAWYDQIGYIPQTIFMLDDTIRANVAFGESEKDMEDGLIWEALKEAAVDSFVRRLPDGLDTRIGERGVRLSGGQRQRIGIARALYRKPEVLVFDEATSALDHDTESAIMESIHGLHGHKTMIIIAHRLTTIADCDHIYRVENGGIIAER